MNRIHPAISALFAIFAGALQTHAQKTATPASVAAVTGFAVLEGEAKLTLPVETGQLAKSLTVRVIDPTGRDWSVSVVNHSIELKPGEIPKNSQKSGMMRTIGEAKLDLGREYLIKLSAVPSTEQAEKKKSKLPVYAPNWVLLTDHPDALDVAEKLLTISAQVTPDARLTNIRTNREGADFQPPATLKEWEARKQELRDQILVTNGLLPMWPKTPLHPKVFGMLDRGDYTIEKVALETLPGFHLSGNLYRPKNRLGKLPAILSPHGHYADGRINEAVQARCIRLAKLGFIVFMHDMVGYNDSKQFKHEFFNDQLNRWGLNLVGFQTFNTIRALDWLETLPDVDSARLGCTGESGGGTQTFLLNAVDDRIAVAAPVVMISEGFQGGCVCENADGMRLGTDNVEIGAMFAPKPMRIVGATGDWTKNTMTIVHPKLEKVYGLYGGSDRIVSSIFNFDHNYNKVSRNAVYPFFAQWFQNLPYSDTLREPELRIETAETLSTIAEDKKIATEMKTPQQLERDLIATQKRQVEKLLSPVTSVEWEANRKLIEIAHKVRTGVREPSANQLVTRVGQSGILREGVQIQRYFVGRKQVQDSVPVVELRPDNFNGVSVVLTSPKGIAGLISNEGKLSRLADLIIQSGASVLAYDPLFTGNAFDAQKPATARPETAHYACYNPSLAQDQAQDLATVIGFAKSRSGTRLVHLAGVHGGGPLALWVRPVLSGVGRTFAAIDGWDDQKEGAYVPSRLKFSGWAQAGGLQGAASLCAPNPVWISAPSRSLDRQKLETVFRFEGAESQLKQDPINSMPDAKAIANWLTTGE